MTANTLLKERIPPKALLPPVANERLPTMYDLPSEDPEEPGLPDIFHIHQPQLLRETFHPPDYSPEQIFEASDLNLYYDVKHQKWHKRPDWFAVLGVPQLYAGRDMRYSYVIWQEKIAPFMVVELLSKSTEKEDLGRTLREINDPPTKWEVYEQWLKIPYYVVFSRKQPDKFQVFRLTQGRYLALTQKNQRFWLPEIRLGLGVWTGTYYNIEHQWLRWYEVDGKWIPTPQENQIKAESYARTEAKRADKEAKRAEKEAQARLMEKQRADTEAQARLTEKQRADKAEAELARLRALLTKP